VASYNEIPVIQEDEGYAALLQLLPNMKGTT
jgi:hypothetical protein